MNRVFVDMDGVVVDFEAYMAENNLTVEQTKHKPGAYLEMKPFPGAIDAVRRLIAMGFEVWIATKPPTGNAFAYAEKAQWIYNHLPELSSRIIITHDKGLLGDAGDYLCDDFPHRANCEKFTGTLVRFVDGYHWPQALEFFQGRLALAPREPAAELVLPPLPEPARKRGQQMSYDGDDKAFFDCFDPVLMRAYALEAVNLNRKLLAQPTASASTAAPSTPAAAWRVSGEPDPHAGHYDQERASLAMGHLTDDELANGAFMNYDRRPSIDALAAGTGVMPIVWMTAVKDRLRWLSRRLEEAGPPAEEREETTPIERASLAADYVKQEVDRQMTPLYEAFNAPIEGSDASEPQKARPLTLRWPR